MNVSHVFSRSTTYSKLKLLNYGVSRSCVQTAVHLKIKFVFSEKATKNDEIFTVECPNDGEDFVNFCGLLKT